MLCAEGLQRHLQLHAVLAVDVDKLVVLQLDDVALQIGNQLGYPQQLAGAVRQMDREGEHPAAVDESVLNDGGHGDNVHIAAGEDGDHILSLAVQMIEGCGGEETCVLYNHLVLFRHVKEAVDQFLVPNGDDAVQMLLEIGEHLVAGRFDSHAVGNGLHCGEGNDLPCLQTGLHRGSALRLHADHLDAGV